MKVGIIGLPQTGKKTLFEVLTRYRFSEKDMVLEKSIKSFAEVGDPRFDRLSEIFSPAKEVRARIDIELLPKLEQDAIAKGEIFREIADADAICHVVRAFQDESVYHVNGSVDSKRDIDTVNSELILNDLLFIEKRLERLEKDIMRVKEKTGAKERELLLRFKEHLEKELPLRLIELEGKEREIIASYPLITLKKMIIALNVSEEGLHDNALLENLIRDYEPDGISIMMVSAKVESEIANLESEEEKKEFLDALGIEEPAINVLARLCIKALNLISFFTVGSDEVRQWTVTEGASAPEAAGAIHTDMQKGFIRAGVIKYNDLLSLGSEEKVKEAGKFYLKGKDYIVEDGDIVEIRFNV